MRVLTMNVFGHHCDWEARRPVLQAGFRRLNPDVVALQEVFATNGYDQVDAVASARIVEEIVGGADRHVVLAGDFDASPDSASIRFWTGRQSLDGTSVLLPGCLGGRAR